MTRRIFSRSVLALALIGAATGTVGCGDTMEMLPEPDLAMSRDLTMRPDLSEVTEDMEAPAEDMEAVEDMEPPIEDMELPTDDMEGVDMAEVDAADVDAAPVEDMPPAGDAAAADGPKACENTGKSCGAPGACVDCTGNTLGTACVMSQCGCNSAADCPAGKACDPMKKQCTDACVGGLDCNGGCCDGQKCVAGNANAACGGDGKGCKACGAGTPTCDTGACTAKCVVGGMGGTCGQGFCCNAQNQCATIGNTACAVAGGACVDCTKQGGKCLQNGTCGCAVAADCPQGQACKGGVCGTVCDANTPCNGGCCAAGKCEVGNTGTACALGQALCGTCLGNAAGAGCVVVNGKTQCGCATQKDCPVGLACDQATKTCTAKCDANNPCNGGCCSAAQNGTCQKGTDLAACGNNGGTCSNCGGGLLGRVCVAAAGGGVCGCNSLADCPLTAVACTNNACDTRCDANKPCQFGCCSGGVCVNGTANGACGKSGLCVDCAAAAGGNVCRPNQVCGCETAANCPKGQACDANTRLCTTKCGANQACNGGCCANGTCAAGTAGNACGSTGNTCLDCTNSPDGKVCVGGKCGCTKSSECGALQACDVGQGKCVNVCTPNQLCNGGCCLSGKCVDGTANSACGGTGGACAICTSGKPTCDKGVCSGKCGGPSDGTCGGGFCCKAGSCVAGNAKTACGYSGACLDCNAQSTGTKCIAPGNSQNWFCGCEARTDCFAANPGAGIGGYACDTMNKNCTSLCGVAGVSQCNGGCCSGSNGTCRAGNADAACGISGGFCTSCTTTCNPGPKCNANTGACGCNNDLGQCNGNFNCAGNNANRYGCNLGSGACCVPGVYNFKDNGNPAGCCTGKSVNGACTCEVAGGSAGTPPSIWACCSLDFDAQGKCRCLPNGEDPDFGLGPEIRACCSNRVDGFGLCVCSKAAQTCQTNAGCCQGLTCQNGVCN